LADESKPFGLSLSKPSTFLNPSDKKEVEPFDKLRANGGAKSDISPAREEIS
jgi:hypothetical protein